jgi:hypothetical protein
MLQLFLLVSLAISQHIWNLVQTNEPSYCQLAQTLDYDFYFVDSSNTSITNFQTINNTFRFGLLLEQNATFNMIYSLACKQTTCFIQPPCPRIVFLIGANGPALPIIYSKGYSGAVGRCKKVQEFLEFQIQYLHNFTKPTEQKRPTNKNTTI